MGKVALITGGSRGIGKAIALELASEGYDIVINYIGGKEVVELVKKEIESYNVKCSIIEADVSNLDECQSLVKKVLEEYDSIDVLVNNAGVTKDNLIIRMSEEEFNTVINVNLKGTFHMTKSVVPIMMKQRSGRIISLASVVGITGNSGQSNYAASKAGIIGFTKSIAKELASRNILANAIAPGFIDTDMTKVLSDDIKENINKQIPLKKMGKPNDIAKLVKFLVSEDSSYITGQVINVDGGMVM